MKYIKTPFIKKETIKESADLFREKFWDETVPVDIEKIIDFVLRINIIPLPSLEKLCNTDALITSNWKYIYIDKNLFEDERRQNRLRFSLAHELGHYVLHSNIYKYFNINSFEDFYKFFDLVPGDQYSYLETQANNFASYLLIPRTKLKVEKQKLLQGKNLGNIDIQLLNSYIARPLSNIFGVSAEAIEIALNDI